MMKRMHRSRTRNRTKSLDNIIVTSIIVKPIIIEAEDKILD